MSHTAPISIQIDGRALQVDPGLTILAAARQNGIHIPTLCDLPGLPAHGACRLCVVEVDGRGNTPTACTTPVEAGQVIATHSPKVVALRRDLIQMLLAEHPACCLFCPDKGRCDECMITLRKAGVTTGCGSCPKDGQCELQALAEEYEVHRPAYPTRYRMLPVEEHDPFFDRDPNLCVLCGRCVQVCQELHFASPLDYKARGAQAQVSTAFQRPHLATACTFCGSCVAVCPTGALTEKTRKWDGRPERTTASTCPFCSIGCQIDLLTKGERVIGSLPNPAAGTDVLCVSGRFGVTELVDPTTRLKHAQLPAGGAWQPAAWEDAVRAAAERLAACPPGRFAMQVSAACTNEDLFVARQFAHQVMGSEPVLASAHARYGGALGIIARLLHDAAPLEALAEAPAVLAIGLDDLYAQSVAAVALKRARARGARLVHLSLAVARSPELGWSDVHLPAAGEDGGGPLRALAALADRLASGGGGSGSAGDTAVERAARLLTEASGRGAPLILVGAAALADPQNTPLLLAVEALAQRLRARVTLLPEEGNLAGALRLGLGAPLPAAAPDGLDVLYRIGEPLPAARRGAPFVIAHALALPDGAAGAGVLFPAAAFSEVDGTLIDHAGRARALRPAAPPPGEALPDWQILAQIARAMGAPGFDYAGVEDVRRAAQAELASAAAQTAWPAPGDPLPGAGWSEPAYLGQPLARRVAGLRSLYPEPSLERAHEPHP